MAYIKKNKWYISLIISIIISTVAVISWADARYIQKENMYIIVQSLDRIEKRLDNIIIEK